MFVYFWIPNSDITAEEFIRRDEHGKTRHDKFKELLAKMLPAKLSDIIVFSVMNIDGKQTDIRFAVRDGLAYYRPEKLHAEMAAFKNEVYSLGLSCICVIHLNTEFARYISQTPVEEYARSTSKFFVLHSGQKHLSRKCLIQAFSLLFSPIHTIIIWLY